MEYERRKIDWLIDSGLRSADYWQALPDGRIRCDLCPRNCLIKKGDVGFCRARYNKNGSLMTAIWGKLLMPSLEPIETEAVFHFWPGAKILSIGNLGCNLRCDFCQNWESSDIRNLSSEHVKYYMPEEIVRLAEALGVRVISFTYNDPAIWFEYVYETAEMARKKGLKTLFKSAAFISEEVAEQLTEVIDIFSISLKTVNPETFSRISKGILQPVLDAIQAFHRSPSHLEISHLVVTGLSDQLHEVRKLSKWVKSELSEVVPLHLVRFHPAYHYREFPRTPVPFLEKARVVARHEGLKYVYIGNTYQSGHADILCPRCSALLVDRFGLHTKLVGLSPDGTCARCGSEQNVILQPSEDRIDEMDDPRPGEDYVWKWVKEDMRNLHVQVRNLTDSATSLLCDHLRADGTVIQRELFRIPGGEDIRFAVGQGSDDEAQIHIVHETSVECSIAELHDRAHFPLQEMVEQSMKTARRCTQQAVREKLHTHNGPA